MPEMTGVDKGAWRSDDKDATNWSEIRCDQAERQESWGEEISQIVIWETDLQFHKREKTQMMKKQKEN